METEASLNDILNGTEPEHVKEPEAAPAETPPEPAEGPARDEHGRFVPKGEKQESPAQGASPAPENEPPLEHPALLGERKRRQAAEDEREQLRREIAELKAPKPQESAQPQAMPDVFEDPEGYARWVTESAVSVAQQQAVRAYQVNRVAQAAEAAKARHEDYAAKIEAFQQMMQENPSLEAQMVGQADPAEWAYQQASQKMLLDQHGGSVAALIEAERKRWEAEAIDGLKAKLPTQTVPPTISNERNVGSREGPAWSGPASLTDILRG